MITIPYIKPAARPHQVKYLKKNKKKKGTRSSNLDQLKNASQFFLSAKTLSRLKNSRRICEVDGFTKTSFESFQP
jgi:hypothetical protein